MFEKIKNVVMECPLCETEKEVEFGIKDEVVDVRGDSISVSGKVYYCPDGQHYFTDIDGDEERIQSAFRKYRERHKLLQPEEIREIREKYGLSQTTFSVFLGFGEKTIHRYEAGAIPDNAHNSLIGFMRDVNSFIKQFSQVRDKLPSQLQKKIENRINEIKTKETPMTARSIDGEFDIVTSDTIKSLKSLETTNACNTNLAYAA